MRKDGVAQLVCMRHAADVIGRDNQNDTHLVAPAVPGVGLAKIFLREHLDMLDRAGERI